jgi:hypothetical protein
MPSLRACPGLSLALALLRLLLPGSTYRLPHVLTSRAETLWHGWRHGRASTVENATRLLGLKIVAGRGRAALRFHLWMHVVHRGWGNSPSQEGEPARDQGVKQSVYHLSRAQNSLQDGRLEASSISMPSLWNFLRCMCDRPLYIYLGI